MRLYASSMTINGASTGRENPLPCFKDTVQDRPIAHDGTFTKDDEELFGFQTGRRVLPYGMQDGYTRALSPLTIKTVILENENLKAVFLPEYGARLYSLYDKRNERELLFRNESLILGNLAQRNAWFSGGIEFNFGHYGHCALTCSPVFAAEINGPYPILRFYEYERTTSLFCQMDFHLPDGAETLEMFVRMCAAEHNKIPVYWWTNIAVRQTERCRVMSGTDDVLFNLRRQPNAPDTEPYMSRGVMPNLKTFNGDCSFPADIDYSCEYFFQNDGKTPWEAICYEDGRMFFETSTEPLSYRKMFCWGNHAGGRNWQRFLNSPKESAYLEIQAGIAKTQIHGAVLAAGDTIEFTQSFGECEAAARLLEDEWSDASREAEKTVLAQVPPETLKARHERYAEWASLPVDKLYHTGSGWGALECAKLQRTGIEPPQGLLFPVSGITKEQLQWRSLLENGILPEHDTPGQAGWLTGEAWRLLLEKSLSLPGGEHWESLLHLGVMYMEEGDAEAARKTWERSVKMRPSAAALRNLSQYFYKSGDIKEAISRMEEALALPDSNDAAYGEEYLFLLSEAGRYADVWDYFETLEACFRTDRCKITVCGVAIELGKNDYLEEFFAEEHYALREFEYALADIWSKWQKKRYGEDACVKLPENLDFGMF